MCNRVCFRGYGEDPSQTESQCHQKCFDNFYSALLYCQRKFYSEVNRK